MTVSKTAGIEADKPARQCKVIKTTVEKDGSKTCEVEALDNGEKMTIVEPPGGKGGSRLFHNKPSFAGLFGGSAKPATTVAPPLASPTPTAPGASEAPKPANWRESWGKVDTSAATGAGEVTSQRPSATGVSPVTSGSLEDRLGGYINPAAFSSSPRGSFGNLARTLDMRGPGQANWDLSIFKSFSIFETFKGQFRAEALNAFNTPMFAAPNTSLGGSGSRTIGGESIRGARRAA